MVARKFPIKDSPEFKDIKARYEIGELDKWQIAEMFNATPLGAKQWLSNSQIYRKPQPLGAIPEEQPEPQIILPSIKLREYKPKKTRRGDEETALFHAGDGHAGKVTISFDEVVYGQRMDTTFDSIMTLVTLHRNMYPINTLRIVNTGDNIQGESPYQGSKVGTIKVGARDQVIKIAYPAWVKLIGSLRQEFAEIVFDGFGGNHGYEKLAPETSREDFRLYDLLQTYFGNTKGITINIHENFGEVIDIMGFRFFCTHFDGIPCQQGIPLFGIDKALKSWYMQFGGFNYALGGHFHKWHYDEVSSRLEYYMVSTLASDDEWALKKLKISSSPSQNLFGVHPTMGLTWKYRLIVDRKFLMEKLPDVYGKEEQNERTNNI